VIFVIVAPFAGYNFVMRFLEGQESTSWPTVEGTVTESSIKESAPSATKRSYKPRVKYAYTVEDEKFSGDRIGMHDVGYGTRLLAEDVLLHYQTGAKIQVHYDPDDPANALLEPGNSWRAYLFLIIPPVMLLLGVLALRFSIPRKPRAPARTFG
jgi:uncharacterized protein DUF3592